MYAPTQEVSSEFHIVWYWNRGYYALEMQFG